MNRNTPILFILMLGLSASLSCKLLEVPTTSGSVTRVADGDSFEMKLLDSGQTARVRLFGIDAPERGQAHANKARSFTQNLLQGQKLSLDIIEEDRFGRLVANVYLDDGRLVNHLIVQAGYAWWFQRFAPNDGNLAALEAEARKNRRGLWQDANPLPPWEFRRKKQR